MSQYFSNFPTITYDNIRSKDITKRNSFIDEKLTDPYVFLPYTVKQGERPEDIALLYYGSVDYTWLILLANNIIDPYLEWHLSDDDFDQYIMSKYAEQSGETGYSVVEWTKNQTIDENILYYYAEVDENTTLEDLLTL